jgi:hypothetical protein
MDKENIRSIENTRQYMLKDLDERDEGHYHDHDENSEDDPSLAKTYGRSRSAPATTEADRARKRVRKRLWEGSIRTTARSSVATT